MSPSTFRQHFRALTGVSPLQYQKQLRLQEARQLMLNQNLDAGSAGGRWVREPVAIQSGVPSPVRRAASARCHAHAARAGRWRLQSTSTAREVRRSRKGSSPSIDPTVAHIPMN